VSSTASTARLQELVDELLVRDADAHAEAVTALEAVGDERVVPHLVEVLIVDGIANDWSSFGFPEILRDRDPPRYLELPEVRWPGAREALASLAEPDFDSAHAWVEWESWYSQQSIEPLAGFEAWKRRLYTSYLPPVGGLLDVEPREFHLGDVRWGNCDRSFLAALNAPDFVPGEAVDASGEGGDVDGDSSDAVEDGGDYERYLREEHHVFGFELDGVAYAVPRWVLFPHELMNAEVGGVPVSLTYCTLCNAPILYDRRVGDTAAGSSRDSDSDPGVDSSHDTDAGHDVDVLTFGNSGMLVAGNKVMYDEETETLWDQHAGVPIGGEFLGTDLVLEQFPVTQTTWGEWLDEYPETLALDVDTGYGYDYEHYDGNISFFRHYWNEESVVQPGVEQVEGQLPEKTEVYGLTSGDASEVWVIPTESFEEPLAATVDGQEVVAVRDATGDVAVYAAPPTPVERDGDALVDADGRRWTIARSELRTDGEARERIPGRHGLWFAFRTHYDEAHVIRSDS